MAGEKAVTTDKPSLGTSLAYGVGSAAFGIKDAGFGIFILVFYSQVIGLDAGLVGAALTTALVLDAVLDPIVGYWSDNFRSRWGRRHLFMYVSAVPVAVSYFLLWRPPMDWSHDAQFIYLLALAILTRFFLTLFETPSAAQAPELTRDYDQRSTLLSFRSFFGWAGGNAMTVLMFFFIFPAFATPAIPNGQFNRDAYVVYGWIASVTIFLSIMISALGTHKRMAQVEQPAPRKMSLGAMFGEVLATLSNRSFFSIFMTGLFANIAVGFANALSVYFSTYFWGFTPIQIGFITLAIFLSAFVGSALAPIVTKRLGKKNGAIVVGFIGMAVSPFAILLKLFGVISTGSDPVTFWVVFLQGQVDVALIVCLQVLLASMISDLVEQAELKTGRRSEGVFFAANTFIQKITTGAGVMVAAVVLGLAHFPAGADPSQVPQSVLMALGWWFLPVILILRLAMTLTTLTYTVSRASHEENLRKLGAAEG